MPMSYHEHMGTIIQTEDDVDKFLNLTNEKTHLLFDTGHLFFAGANYVNILKKYFFTHKPYTLQGYKKKNIR